MSKVYLLMEYNSLSEELTPIRAYKDFNVALATLNEHQDTPQEEEYERLYYSLREVDLV